MKKVVIIIFLFFVFICLTFVTGNISINAEVEHEDLEAALNNLNSIQKDLRKTSKAARSISREIRNLVKEIKADIKLQEDDCNQKAKDALVKLKQVISQIRNNQCIEAVLRTTKPSKCIPGEVLTEFLPQLEEANKAVEAFFQIDINSNLIPDVCEKGEICTNPCGPDLCCRENQACEVDDPCMGDPACTSIPTFGCIPPDDENVFAPLMRITSPAFENDGDIPIEHTCDSKNVSPAIKIENPPGDTKSFALIVDDPDAPGGTFIHWIVFNIPGDLLLLASNFPNTTTPGTSLGTTKQGINGFGETKYGGPCPPVGETHRYIFTLYALDTLLNLETGATKEQLLSSIQGHILSKAELVGKYKSPEGSMAIRLQRSPTGLSYFGMSIFFEENNEEVNKEVKFLSRGNNYSLLLKASDLKEMIEAARDFKVLDEVKKAEKRDRKSLIRRVDKIIKLLQNIKAGLRAPRLTCQAILLGSVNDLDELILQPGLCSNDIIVPHGPCDGEPVRAGIPQDEVLNRIVTNLNEIRSIAAIDDDVNNFSDICEQKKNKLLINNNDTILDICEEENR